MERDRKLTFNEYKGKKTKELKHYFLDYDRYSEAAWIHSFLKKNNWHGQNVLDYGCGVGDYGVYLISKGHKATFYDINQTYTDFVKFRLENKKSDGKVIDEKTTNKLLVKDQDVVIFGEVLENMMFPDRPLKVCIEAGVRTIVTSSYMFRTDKGHFLKKGHKLSAYFAQTKCLKLLEDNYNSWKPDTGGFRCWYKK